MKQYKIKAGTRYPNLLDVPIPKFSTNESFSHKYIIEADNYDFGIRLYDWATLCGVGTGLNQNINSVRAVWRFNANRSTFEWKIVREVNKVAIASDSLFGATCIATYNIDEKTFDIQVDSERATYNMGSMDDRSILWCPIILNLQPHFVSEPANADYKIMKI